MLFDTQTSTAHAAVNQLQADANTLIDTLDQTIAVGNATIDSLKQSIAADTVQIQADAAQIADLKAQLASLPPPSPATTIYDHLEKNVWGQNADAIVGGGGAGTASQKQPSIECAEFSVAPTLLAGKDNYFDCYYTQVFKPDASNTKYRLEASWLFPTLADANACHCLEMEGRQVMASTDMFVPAIQLRFSTGTIRYFDHSNVVDRWAASGLTIQRFAPLTWYTVVLDAHRDATKLYYDSVTINGVRSALTQTAPTYRGSYVNPRTSCSLQLDAKNLPYRVKIDNVKYTVSQ